LSICREVPYRVLCVACDSAIYRDHIASAIASAVSVANGADLINAVTRSEHIKQPSKEDIIEAIETAKIAAHCGEIVRRRDVVLDESISKNRGSTSCLAKGTQAILPRRESESDDPCSMCGECCALKIMQKIRNNKVCMSA
jgi:thiamine biosynthesis protein ThiC